MNTIIYFLLSSIVVFIGGANSFAIELQKIESQLSPLNFSATTTSQSSSKVVKSGNEALLKKQEENKAMHIGITIVVWLVALLILRRFFFKSVDDACDAYAQHNRGVKVYVNSIPVYRSSPAPDIFVSIKYFLWIGLSSGLAYGTFFLLQNLTVSAASVSTVR